MKIEARSTKICGVWEISNQHFCDSRGSFLNIFRSQEPAISVAWGERPISQINVSRTELVGTVRGLHLQSVQHGDAKLVRCMQGCVWDVAVDLRPESTTYGQWHAVFLTPGAANAIVIPEGCAHGYQVIEAGSELLYIHSGEWVPSAETGVRCNDPQLAITWPMTPVGLSERDKCLPFLKVSQT